MHASLCIIESRPSKPQLSSGGPISCRGQIFFKTPVEKPGKWTCITNFQSTRGYNLRREASSSGVTLSLLRGLTFLDITHLLFSLKIIRLETRHWTPRTTS